MKFVYNSNGLLIAFEAHFTTNEQITWLHHHMPWNVADLQKLAKAIKTAKLTELKPEPPTFDDFYEAYNNKVGRKKAENVWSRMSNEKKAIAFAFIARYHGRCKLRGIAAMYPATYLNQEPWND